MANSLRQLINQHLLGRRKVYPKLFLLLFFAFCYIHQGVGSNQDSRLSLLHSLFKRCSFQIDEYAPKTHDKAYYRGHFYSDKPPGIAFLSIPAFAAAYGTSRFLGVEPDSQRGWMICSWIATVGSVALISAAGGLAAFSLFSTWISGRSALISTLAISLGSLPFLYSTALVPHALVIGLVFIALWAIYVPRDPMDVIAGLSCGFALAGELTAGIPAIAIVMIRCSKRKGNLLRFFLSFFAPLLLLPLYSAVCFGNPFIVPYELNPVFPSHRNGFFGLTLQLNWKNLNLLTFSPSKGLLFWSPFLVLAVAGLPGLARRSLLLLTASCLVPLIQLIAISMNFDPGGGYAISARYLSAALPFLGLAAAFGIERCRRLGFVLTALSIAMTTLATTIDTTLSNRIPHPLLQYYFPRVLEQNFKINIGSLFGLSGGWSLAPLIIIVSGLALLLWRNLAEVATAPPAIAVEAQDNCRKNPCTSVSPISIDK